MAHGRRTRLPLFAELDVLLHDRSGNERETPGESVTSACSHWQAVTANDVGAQRLAVRVEATLELSGGKDRGAERVEDELTVLLVCRTVARRGRDADGVGLHCAGQIARVALEWIVPNVTRRAQLDHGDGTGGMT